MTAKTIFALVSGGALGGMVMGALFGWAAGSLTPTFFAHFLPWNDVEPRGFAIVLGATAGVFLGGGLSVFAVLVQLLWTWRTKPDRPQIKH